MRGYAPPFHGTTWRIIRRHHRERRRSRSRQPPCAQDTFAFPRFAQRGRARFPSHARRRRPVSSSSQGALKGERSYPTRSPAMSTSARNGFVPRSRCTGSRSRPSESTCRRSQEVPASPRPARQLPSRYGREAHRGAAPGGERRRCRASRPSPCDCLPCRRRSRCCCGPASTTRAGWGIALPNAVCVALGHTAGRAACKTVWCGVARTRCGRTANGQDGPVPPPPQR